jgi:pyruvate,orthophosphate dikinase
MATNIDQLEKTKPKIYQELSTIAQQLEKHFNAIQDIEFTVENNQLYILQTRNAKISSNAQKQLLKNGDIQ